jgi:hypothetical protein
VVHNHLRVFDKYSCYLFFFRCFIQYPSISVLFEKWKEMRRESEKERGREETAPPPERKKEKRERKIEK